MFKKCLYKKYNFFLLFGLKKKKYNLKNFMCINKFFIFP